MNSDLRNRALEARLFGEWICKDKREICEYAFFPHNEFTCVIKRTGESPFKVRGYWDILGEQLRLGTSALTNESAHLLRVDTNSFSAERARRVVVFERRSG